MTDRREPPGPLTPAQRQALTSIRAELARQARYDDESVVHEQWIRQRYDTGAFASYAPARAAAVQTAWHEAGHAVAALAVGAVFSSASIRPSASQHGPASQGRVRGIAGLAGRAFVVDAAGQIGEQLRRWDGPGTDQALRDWLRGWHGDGGDARRFRRSVAGHFSEGEVAAWRLSERLLTPRRLQIQRVARALLVHPRHLPGPVVAALAQDC